MSLEQKGPVPILNLGHENDLGPALFVDGQALKAFKHADPLCHVLATSRYHALGIIYSGSDGGIGPGSPHLAIPPTMPECRIDRIGGCYRLISVEAEGDAGRRRVQRFLRGGRPSIQTPFAETCT